MKSTYKNALKAIRQEILTFPCLGLVSKVNSGSHKDMNYITFLKSYKVLKKLIKYIDKNIDKIYDFNKLKELGYYYELMMFKKTNNINTHKGLIFSLSIFFYSYLKTTNSTEMVSFIKDFVAQLEKTDYKILNTPGANLYVKHKINGARFVALSGYSIVFDTYSFYLKEIKDLKIKNNYKHFILLLKIVTLIQDTTLINKIGLTNYKSFQIKSSNLINQIIRNDKNYENKISAFNNYAIENNISPGGAADLLVLVLFLINENYNF